MLIQDLFERDVFRPINGVVKAHQLDAASVWQELDEFVLTKELDKHFRKFLAAYLDPIDHPNEAAITDRMGVWISGFFGSGKSHFLKILAYLLKNDVHSYEGQSKQAVEFFERKIEDAMLFGDVKRAVASNTDVILFNIDSKADAKAGREAILAVFLKVLNEMQGYSPDHPHIAHMERYLDGKGKLTDFHVAFKEVTGSDWVEERDVYEFNRDQVVEAFQKTLGQSKESAEKWIDTAEKTFSLSVENFARWVKEYLDAKGPQHRLIFLVDEIGQFVGTDGHLMLNLQTITEDLGTACKGRAWIVVTAQEEIDKIIGELRTATANDFSKIQARFNTRLSLSSANADEVIQSRLLAKREEVKGELRARFGEKGDVLRHQLTFTGCGMTMRNYRDTDDFVTNYPFAPYQFQIIQKVFEAVRRVGASGAHLARGERSMLDAFQTAAKKVGASEVGILVPLYEFYPSIESFLDTLVARTIEQASENTSLEPFDIKLLQVLFLIRYVEEVKGNVDNLVTLCVDQIDADKLALRRRIEDSLARLEKETLINRSGDTYFFLTNEERDISREVKSVDLSSGEEAKLLGDIIFEDVFKGQRKHRYSVNRVDFSFTRICDMHPVGSRVEGGLVVSVVSPLNDDYQMYNDQRCVLESSGEGGQITIRLEDNVDLGRELRAYAKTEKYLRTKSDSTLPDSAKRILRDNAEDNRGRRERLIALVGDMLTEASYFVAGQSLKVGGKAPGACLEEALEYLIANTFSKMGYVKHLCPEPTKEIQAILRRSDVNELGLDLEEANPQAIDDLRNYIDLCAATSKQVVLHEMIENRYGRRPYGWPPEEVLILLARLIVQGEISLMMDAAILPIDKVYAAISASAKWRKITVIKRHTSDPKALQAARGLGKDVFSQMGPDGEDALFDFLTGKLRNWQTSLTGYKSLAETVEYPGREEIAEGLTLINTLVGCNESVKFIERFLGHKTDLLNLCDNFHDLENFYEHQRPTWDKLRKAYDRFALNRLELERDEATCSALAEMKQILTAASPYKLIQRADGLISTIEGVNTRMLQEAHEMALAHLNELHKRITEEVEAAGGDDALKRACLARLEPLRTSIQAQESLAHITQAVQEADRVLETALDQIDALVKKRSQTEPSRGDPSPPTPKPRKQIRPASLMNKTYLETPDDVKEFLDALRTALEEAIAREERIQIR